MKLIAGLLAAAMAASTIGLSDMASAMPMPKQLVVAPAGETDLVIQVQHRRNAGNVNRGGHRGGHRGGGRNTGAAVGIGIVGGLIAAGIAANEAERRGAYRSGYRCEFGSFIGRDGRRYCRR